MFAAVFTLALAATGNPFPDPPKPANAKEALQPFNVLVGSWKGTGYPENVTKEERAAGMWVETDSWTWKFKGEDAWLEVAFEQGKHFTTGELRYLAEKNAYQLKLTAADKSTVTYVGTLKEKVLTLDRVGGPSSEEQRLVFSLLHNNRHLYRFETRPANSTLAFDKKFQVGATKEGVPFADVPKGLECIVSGGAGTIKVSYMGKDYYVCCTGCRDEFKADPEKYIKEAAEKAKKK
jgi:YHS domain-containing protein